ncbi:PEP-CTERM sorting domain-containing protein [Oxalobacteraceae bacterium A2-2]
MKALFPALLLALAVHGGGAQAAAQASAGISAVTLGVIDLTPDDGRAAAYRIDSFNSRLIAYTDTRNSGGSFEREISYPAPSTASRIEAALGSTLAGAGVTGALGAVSAWTAANASLGLDNAASGESEQRLWLTLAPHTLLTVGGQVWTEASRSLDGAGYRVFTWAAVDISDRNMTTVSYLTRESTLVWGENTTWAGSDDAFLLAFANPGNTSLAVSLNFLAYTDVAVAAVPEPATWAMLLAGLALGALRLTASRGIAVASTRHPWRYLPS